MKISNLSIVFCIIFIGLLSTFSLKREVSRKLTERDRIYEEAYSRGIKAAAGKMAEELTLQAYYTREIAAEDILAEFYRTAALELGLEHRPDYRSSLESTVPIFAVLNTDCYELITLELLPDSTIKSKSSGKLSYGSENGAPCTLEGQGRETCIEAVENSLTAALLRSLQLKGIERDIAVDLPEYSGSDFVQTLKGPAVLAISLLQETGKRNYRMKLYGAELGKPTLLYEVMRDGKREYHNENCERIKETIEQKKYLRTYESVRAAVAAGCLPQSCCEPFSAYLFDYMVGGR